MCRYAYKIKMQTPLGEKRGTMLFRISESNVKGFINIFGHKGSFSGEIKENGEYCLRGQIITLIRTIDYIATGRTDGDKITLTLKSERNIFCVTGLSCPAEDIL